MTALKQQRRGRVISNFAKGQTFSFFMTTSALWGNLTVQSPFLHPQKKAFLSSSVCPRREYTWTLSPKESVLICFENCQCVPYSQRQSRNKMMNTFLIVNITPHVRNSLDNKSMLVHFKKAFLLSSVRPGTEYTWALI